MFVAAEKVNAEEALRIGLVHAVAEEPVTWAVGKLKQLVIST
jgi:enoyl-CoA hydratase/carnithine racemase